MISTRYKQGHCLKVLAEAGADFGLTINAEQGVESVAKSIRWAVAFQKVDLDVTLYDDSICNTARTDRKTMVTRLWIEHSWDAGMPVDPTSVMYTPLRDMNGLPGAKSLVIYLTRYLREDRDDVRVLTTKNKDFHFVCEGTPDKYKSIRGPTPCGARTATSILIYINMCMLPKESSLIYYHSLHSNCTTLQFA